MPDDACASRCARRCGGGAGPKACAWDRKDPKCARRRFPDHRRRCQLFSAWSRKTPPVREGVIAKTSPALPGGCTISVRAVPVLLPRFPKDAGSLKGRLPGLLHCIPRDAMRLTGRFAFFPPFLPEGIIGFQRAVPPLSRRFPKDPAVPGGLAPVSPALPEGCAGSSRTAPKPLRRLPKMPAFRDRQVPARSRFSPKGSAVPGRLCHEFPHAPEGMCVLSRRCAPLSAAMPEGLAVSGGARRPFPFGPKPLRIYSLARPEARRGGPGTVVFPP